MSYTKPQDVTRSTFSVPNGSLSAAQTIPAGTVQAWVTFSAAVGDLTVEYNAQATHTEFIASAEGWEYLPAPGAPTDSAQTFKMQGTAAVTGVLHLRSAS